MGRSLVISRVSTTKKIMALTFDDGSDAAKLNDILKILSANNIKCTFFLTGKASEDHPSLITQIIDQGHEIGNHSYSHPQFTSISSSAMQSEITKAETSITDIAGVSPKPFFRPPYGAYSGTVLDAVGNLGYSRTIMWTVDTIDWNNTPADVMVEKVLSNSKTGAIVLMHTGGGTHTTEALPKIITGLKQKGYFLSTISTLLATARPVLRRGSIGSMVEELQRILIKLGFNAGSIDGRFGPLTETAVKAFQSGYQLEVDGIVGPKTWDAIDHALEALPVDHSALSKGSTGESVIYLQQVLSKLGFYLSTIDGRFGPLTHAAVKLFQSSKGLDEDGIVGPETWAAIDEIMEYTINNLYKLIIH